MEQEKEKTSLGTIRQIVKVLRRIFFGKSRPPLFLRVLSWSYLAWSLLMILFFGFIMALFFIGGTNEAIVEDLGLVFYVVYLCLHGASILGIALMWRLKRLGFYIFCAAHAAMPFAFTVLGDDIELDYTMLIFSGVTIGLFGLNAGLFFKKKESSEDYEEEETAEE